MKVEPIKIPTRFGESYFFIDAQGQIRLIKDQSNKAIYIGKLSGNRKILFLRKDKYSERHYDYSFCIPNELLTGLGSIEVICLEFCHNVKGNWKESMTPYRRFVISHNGVELYGTVIDDERSVTKSHQEYVYVPCQYWDEAYSDDDVMEFFRLVCKTSKRRS